MRQGVVHVARYTCIEVYRSIHGKYTIHIIHIHVNNYWSVSYTCIITFWVQYQRVYWFINVCIDKYRSVFDVYPLVKPFWAQFPPFLGSFKLQYAMIRCFDTKIPQISLLHPYKSPHADTLQYTSIHQYTCMIHFNHWSVCVWYTCIIHFALSLTCTLWVNNDHVYHTLCYLLTCTQPWLMRSWIHSQIATVWRPYELVTARPSGTLCFEERLALFQVNMLAYGSFRPKRYSLFSEKSWCCVKIERCDNMR